MRVYISPLCIAALPPPKVRLIQPADGAINRATKLGWVKEAVGVHHMRVYAYAFVSWCASTAWVWMAAPYNMPSHGQPLLLVLAIFTRKVGATQHLHSHRRINTSTVHLCMCNSGGAQLQRYKRMQQIVRGLGKQCLQQQCTCMRGGAEPPHTQSHTHRRT